MKHIIGLMALLLPILCGAQSPPVKALNIGDTVPDITLTNVYNYPDSVIRLSDLKGKLVILDFWATWCGSCIQTFPKMHDLKKEFGEKLQLLFVNRDTNQTQNKVASFFEKRKLRTGQSFEFPYVLHDTLLLRYFPNKSIPHYVWLDSALSVVAITGADEITSFNIQQFFSGIKLSMAVKNDANAFDCEKPLLIDGNGGSPDGFIYRSILTGYKEGLGMSLGKDQRGIKEITRIYIINYSLFSLFKIAYPEVLKYPPNRTFIEVADSLLFIRIENKEQMKKNRFCYELITLPTSQKKILKYLRDDLLRNFHAVAYNEKRFIDCYVLTANKSISHSLTKGGPSSKDTDKESLNKYFRNSSVSDLTSFFNTLLDKPVVNETNLKNRIDIPLPVDLYSYNAEELSSFLSGYGFTLAQASRLMEVAIISESRE